MTKEEFVKASKSQTSDAALFGTVSAFHKPPGRKPDKKDVELSEWYCKLSAKDQEFVFAAMKEAAELAVFSLFCILDGVSAVEDSREKGTLQLTYTKGPAFEILNSATGDQLHDLYNELCKSSHPHPPERESTREYAVGLASFLRSLQTSRDSLDIQIETKPDSNGLDQNVATAIALPKAEHRKL